MEKLIESRGQYDELRYKVGEELRTIQNVRDLLGGDCIKEEYNKYIKALHGQEGKGSPSQASATERLAIKRAELQEKCERIEQTAIEADADIYQWLLEGVTTDYATYIYLRDAKGLPCGDQKYYRARRKFYWLMSKKI